MSRDRYDYHHWFLFSAISFSRDAGTGGSQCMATWVSLHRIRLRRAWLAREIRRGRFTPMPDSYVRTTGSDKSPGCRQPAKRVCRSLCVHWPIGLDASGMPQRCPIVVTGVQQPRPASIAIQLGGAIVSVPRVASNSGTGIGQAFAYTTACRGVACSEISRPASISTRRSSHVF